MTILLMMIPMALILGGGFLFAFIWATKDGQFDDTLTPAHRILFDENENRNGFVSEDLKEKTT